MSSAIAAAGRLTPFTDAWGAANSSTFDAATLISALAVPDSVWPRTVVDAVVAIRPWPSLVGPP